ncbi:unnamed protein product [Effrenium voratum]|uniref:Uncharacterized protein n=1 Tax=Effrenium voratum TaxID=2562239 RepID=A0AA36MT22_9DINO|nr:unnamed protein product [Effrenium voratum]
MAPPKRRHDENLEPNRPALTGKRARQGKPEPQRPGPMLEWIQRNREAALERKRRHQDMPASATQSEPQAQKAEEDMPASVPRSEPQAEKAEEDMPASVPRSDMPASVPRSEPQAQKAEKEEAAEESSSSSEDSSDEGTSSTSCTSQTSAGESGSDVEDEEPEEEAEEVDEEEEEAFEKEKEDEEKEEQEEKEEESEDENLPKVRGVCAPRGEPPCCTERWPAVQLQPLTPGKVLVPKKERNAKQKLVATLLCRWWYVLPDWPPRSFDYDAALARRGYRQVPVEVFESEPEGELRKCFPLSGGYRGLFRDEQGLLIDVRPVEGRPSYDQLMLRSTPELHQLVVLAYTRQLEELESVPLTATVEAQRGQLQTELMQAKQQARFSGMFMKTSQ